jgi:hypothetical protein
LLLQSCKNENKVVLFNWEGCPTGPKEDERGDRVWGKMISLGCMLGVLVLMLLLELELLELFSTYGD